jgi:hypothetical protein
MTDGRSGDLLVAAIGWLESDSEVTQRLGDDGAVLEVDKIIGEDPNEADPRLVVDVEERTSDRNNKQEDKQFNLIVMADATDDYVRGTGTNAVRRLLDAAKEVLTTHPGDRWVARGVEEEVNEGYVENIKRYRRMARIRINRNDLRPTYG